MSLFISSSFSCSPIRSTYATGATSWSIRDSSHTPLAGWAHLSAWTPSFPWFRHRALSKRANSPSLRWCFCRSHICYFSSHFVYATVACSPSQNSPACRYYHRRHPWRWARSYVCWYWRCWNPSKSCCGRT